MKNEEQETICYTIEREFSGKITVKELVRHIIREHMKNSDPGTTEKCNQEKHPGAQG